MSETITNHVMIAIELISMLVLLVLLYGTLAWNKNQDEKTKCYLGCLISSFIGLCADIITWIYGNSSDQNGLVFVMIIIAVLSMYMISTMFTFYVTAVIREKAKITWKYPCIIACFNLVLAAVFLILIFFGKAVSIENGSIVYDDWYTAASVGGALAIFINIYIIFKYRKALGTKNVIALLSYGVLPAIAASLMFSGTDLELGPPSITIAMLVIYVMIQSAKVSELELRAQILTELSRIDSLTGLNSRSYFHEMAETWQDMPRGVVFCDLNILKYINDTISHKAGDELLKKFASILKTHFDPEELFRISGDEFLLVSEKDEKTFNEAVESLREDLRNNGEIASVGAVYSKDGQVQKMIAEAEKRMYEDKKKYHDTHPELTRR